MFLKQKQSQTSNDLFDFGQRWLQQAICTVKGILMYKYYCNNSKVVWLYKNNKIIFAIKSGYYHPYLKKTKEM